MRPVEVGSRADLMIHTHYGLLNLGKYRRILCRHIDPLFERYLIAHALATRILDADIGQAGPLNMTSSLGLQSIHLSNLKLFYGFS
jgi:hypothetical protein